MSSVKFKDSIEITVSKELKLFIRSVAASYRFIFSQQRYELVQKADMLELVELEKVAELASRFAAVMENTKLNLTRHELYELYTMLDLVCKSFLCDIGDDYKAIAMKLNQVDEDRYNQVRSTELSIAQVLIQQIRKDFSADPEFEEIVERLEMLE